MGESAQSKKMGNKLGRSRGEDTHTQSRFHLKMRTPTENLLMAICKGDVSAAREAIIAGAEVDWRAAGQYGGTPLHAAAMKGEADIIRMLVSPKTSGGANVDAKERKYGRTALMEAAWHGHAAAAEALLDCGATLEATDDSLGRTALSIACDKAADAGVKGSKSGHLDTVKLLLSRGADPNAADQAGKTALHWAASQGNGECILALLEAGAVLDSTDYLFRRTPLHYAAQNAQPEAYDALVTKGADPNIQDVRGNTPLECCSGIKLQGQLGEAPRSMLDKSIPVPSWDEIHGETPAITA